MAKKFNIHDWQAKIRLNEQFTPDLEDDELKRSKIQQMMAKEKESEYELSDEEKDQLTDVTNEFIRKLTDVRGGNYSDDRLLAALQFIQLVIQDAEPMLYNDEEELDEANVTGGGAGGSTFNAGTGMGYASPAAFAKSEKDWKGKKAVYSEQEEQPAVDDQGNPIETEPEDIPDTPSDLAKKMKDISSSLKKPGGAKGLDKSEIENLSIVLDRLITAMQDGNASQVLKKIANIIP